MMTGAEFDTMRRQLGLSIDETALALGGGVSDRQVRRWCSGKTDLPNDVVEAVIRLEAAMADGVERIIRLATNFTAAGPVGLIRYRTQTDLDQSPDAGIPLGAHAMVIAWASDALADEGIETRIGWADD